MNGPAHYAEAERLITEAEASSRDVITYLDAADPDAADNAQTSVANHLAAAHVHATLALAAATASARLTYNNPRDNGSSTYLGDHDAWGQALA